MSLKTSQRYRAVGNADYLKQRLVDGIRSYKDFDDIRMTSRLIASSELSSEREQHHWFASGDQCINLNTPSPQRYAPGSDSPFANTQLGIEAISEPLQDAAYPSFCISEKSI
ncbi:hypothetical protein [Photobacterium marinum]|uniref:hypothetical protein n=1 Tax=Photobacterium marinum TaxID=1056511 RepID=UPI0012F795DD|nr:hypothetical protein [Photobacterium marinum]